MSLNVLGKKKISAGKNEGTRKRVKLNKTRKSRLFACLFAMNLSADLPGLGDM